MAQAKGRPYSPDELARRFSHAVFPRTTNRYGCVTLHSYHFYIEEGLPQTQVLLWVYGEHLRAVFDNVVLAEYHCRYDWRERKVKNIQGGVFYPTRFASPPGIAPAVKRPGILGALSPSVAETSSAIAFPGTATPAFRARAYGLEGLSNHVQSAEVSTDVKDVVARFAKSASNPRASCDSRVRYRF